MGNLVAILFFPLLPSYTLFGPSRTHPPIHFPFTFSIPGYRRRRKLAESIYKTKKRIDPGICAFPFLFETSLCSVQACRHAFLLCRSLPPSLGLRSSVLLVFLGGAKEGHSPNTVLDLEQRFIQPEVVKYP